MNACVFVRVCVLTCRSPEFAEPPERLHLFSRVREWQGKGAHRMVKHVEVSARMCAYGRVRACTVCAFAFRSAGMVKHVEMGMRTGALVCARTHVCFCTCVLALGGRWIAVLRALLSVMCT